MLTWGSSSSSVRCGIHWSNQSLMWNPFLGGGGGGGGQAIELLYCPILLARARAYMLVYIYIYMEALAKVKQKFKKFCLVWLLFLF